MSRFRVSLVRVDSTSVVVEAEDEEAALAAAFEEDLPSLCAQCSGWGRDVTVDEGEWTTASELWPDDKSPDVELTDGDEEDDE